LPVLPTYLASELISGAKTISGDFIIKPINGGSSVGVVKFTCQADLINYQKFNSGFEPDKFFAEPFIRGTELTTSIIHLEDLSLIQDSSHIKIKHSNNLVSLPLLELRPKNEFYDYEAKYTEGLTEFVLPAQISKELENRIHDYAISAFEIMSCKSAARVDFIITSEGCPYIFEINTLPGMTNTSDLPAQAKSAGISYDQVVERVLLDS
jgi:D-alanine-D-alanine ligase